MSRPTAAAIAAELRESIRTGRYGLGVRLPSASVLQARHGVARGTVTTAIGMLRWVYPDGATISHDSAVLTADHALVYELPVEQG